MTYYIDVLVLNINQNNGAVYGNNDMTLLHAWTFYFIPVR